MTFSLPKFKTTHYLQDYRFVFVVWILLALFVGVIKQLTCGLHANYTIYKLVFYHFQERVSLYPAPTAILDTNHYGPLFSLIIAPFAALPESVGAPLWLVANVSFLFYAIKQLPLVKWQHAGIYWFATIPLFTAITNVQFNISIAAIIILSYCFIQKEKDGWAAFLIVLGTLVKLYGVVGLAFFFFSKHKLKFIMWCAIWGIALFAIPMMFAPPEYVIGQYKAWYICLIEKNQANELSAGQDISVMGMIRRLFHQMQWSNLPFLATGLVLFLLPYLRIKHYSTTHFRLSILSSVLLFTVLFSTGSEPNTYLIAILGVIIWFIIQPRPFTRYQWAILLFVFLFTCMAPSDLFPRWLYQNYMRPYALMALPCLLAWITIIYNTTWGDYKNKLNS